MTTPNIEGVAGEIAARFRSLRLVIPDPEPFALHWTATGDCTTVPIDQADTDDLILTTEDLLDYGKLTIEDLAEQCVSIVLESQKTYPHRWSWRRWPLTRQVASLLYVSGITRSGGGSTHSGRDPHRVVYHMPRWSDVLPRRGGSLRPYVLGRPAWWWRCLHIQFPRFYHWPGPAVYGQCGTCFAWPCCGAVGWDHEDDCPEYTPLIVETPGAKPSSTGG